MQLMGEDTDKAVMTLLERDKERTTIVIKARKFTAMKKPKGVSGKEEKKDSREHKAKDPQEDDGGGQDANNKTQPRKEKMNTARKAGYSADQFKSLRCCQTMKPG